MQLVFRNNPILIAAALLAAMAVVYFAFRRDAEQKAGKWPRWMAVSLVLLGLLAGILAVFAEWLVEFIMYWFTLAVPGEKARGWLVLIFFVLAACLDVLLQCYLLEKRIWEARFVRRVTDGVFSGLLVALGFALAVALHMFGYTRAEVPYDAYWSAGRALSLFPYCACIGAFSGVWYGMARRCADWNEGRRCRLFRWLARLLPLLLSWFFGYFSMLPSAWYGLLFVLLAAACLGGTWYALRQLPPPRSLGDE